MKSTRGPGGIIWKKSLKTDFKRLTGTRIVNPLMTRKGALSTIKRELEKTNSLLDFWKRKSKTLRGCIKATQRDIENLSVAGLKNKYAERGENLSTEQANKIIEYTKSGAVLMSIPTMQKQARGTSDNVKILANKIKRLNQLAKQFEK